MKMIWDKEAERQLTGGVDHGVGYLKKNGVWAGHVWNGLTSWECSNEGADANVLWADNIKYGILRGAESYSGSITTYTIPVELYPIIGLVDLGGIYAHEQAHETFRAAYRQKLFDANGFVGYRHHVVYGLTCGANSETADTLDDNPDAAELSWDIDGVPVTVTYTKDSVSKTVTNCEFTFETKGEDFPAATTRIGKICRILYGWDSGDTIANEFTTYATAAAVGALVKNSTKNYICIKAYSGASFPTTDIETYFAEVPENGSCPDANALFNITDSASA